MPWWIVGVGWHWCLSFNTAKLLKFGACLIFRVVKCVLLCPPSILLCSFGKALRVCSVSWQDWAPGDSHQSQKNPHQSQVLPEDLQVNSGWVLCVLPAQPQCSVSLLQADGKCHQLCGKKTLFVRTEVSQVLGTSWAVHSLSKVLRDLRESLRWGLGCKILLAVQNTSLRVHFLCPGSLSWPWVLGFIQLW